MKEAQVNGYSIQEKIRLQTPKIKKSLFGLLKHTLTHDTRELCYLSSDNANRYKLFVKINERPIIDACEEVAERVDGKVVVKYTF